MFTPILLVALGGAFGSVARFASVTAATRLFGPAFPLGTLAVNVAGSFAMGALAVLLAGQMRPFLLTGVLGGFTTFSAFSLDAVTLWERGEVALAALYTGASVILSLAALAAGAALARAAA